MANPHKGEVAIVIGDKTFTLAFSANALCEIESILDKGIAEIAELMSDAKRLRVSVVRAVFWGGLRQHHPGLSLSDVGWLVDEIGMPAMIGHLTKAFDAAFPESSKDPQ